MRSGVNPLPQELLGGARDIAGLRSFPEVVDLRGLDCRVENIVLAEKLIFGGVILKALFQASLCILSSA